MFFFFKSLVFQIFVVSLHSCAVANIQKFSVTKETGFAATKSLFQIIPASSTIICACFCNMKNQCYSASHDKTTKTCSLYDCCFPDTETVLDKITIRRTPEQGIYVCFSYLQCTTKIIFISLSQLYQNFNILNIELYTYYIKVKHRIR